jgi:hypothetical protein
MPAMPPEYYRRYRATVRPKKERAARTEGVAEGVQLCVKLLETLYGEKSVTGFQAASAIRKTLLHRFPAIPST